MRVSAIIEARMSSSRLPGKVMMPFGNIPNLAVMCSRVSAANLVDTIVVATPDSKVNKPIWDLCEQSGGRVKLAVGPEDDVLARVLMAATETRTDVIVELTGDCPLIDARIIDLVASYYICGRNSPSPSEDWDVVCNSKPRTWPRGMDVRVFSTEALRKTDAEVRGDARESYWREHVSPWMYERQDSPYRVLNIEAPETEIAPDLNLSIDTREDYRRCAGIFEALQAGNPAFTIHDMLEYLAGLPGYETLRAPDLVRPAAWIQS